MSANHSTTIVAIKQNPLVEATTAIKNGTNGSKTNHELVVVRANGQVTVDLIEHSPELT